MLHTTTLRFTLRKPVGYNARPVPIYLRITVDGQRSEISTHRECEPEKWINSTGRMSGTKDNAKQLNAYLDSLLFKVRECEAACLANRETVTAEKLKNMLTGKSEKVNMLVPIFEYHNRQIEELVGTEYATATLTRYKTTLQHVINFLEWKYGKSDIDIKELNHRFITEFDFYMRSERKCNNNSTAKYIKNFRKVIRICIANDWLQKDPFANFKIKIKEPERSFLSQEELTKIDEKKFIMPRMNQVKDIFLFSCYTGLAYVDVQKLTRSNIVVGIDGKFWINTSRTKTETTSNIPLLPPAMTIIERYKDHPQVINKRALLPILSNQKMNAYLKEITDACGIEKELTFHCARHTFATTVTLSNGVSIESVSKMLGHKNLRTTQHYAKILDQKVSSDMSSLFEKYENKTSAEVPITSKKRL